MQMWVGWHFLGITKAQYGRGQDLDNAEHPT